MASTRTVLWIVLLAGLAWPGAIRAESVVVVLSGVPGSPEHTQRFRAWVDGTRTAMIESFGHREDAVVVLDNPRLEAIQAAFTGLRGRVGAGDTLFVFFIGHGSFDGRDYKFNTLGPDWTAAEYSELIGSAGAGRIVIVNATNSSGASIEAFAGPNRVVVTATRSGTERNDTIFYDHFLAALTDPASDEDRNQRLSVWEAFRFSTLSVERFYSEQNRLATEHPQISDNGAEPTGVQSASPTLARLVNFNRVAEITVSDPALRALLEERQQLEADIEALRLVRDITPEAEYEARMEALLVELALKNQEIRQQENAP